jgi:hypothetical protein
MAIQHVKSLAKKARTQTTAVYAYRSSVEVLECARSLCTASVAKRDQDEIASTGQQVEDLYGKLNNMRTLVAQARYALHDMPDQRVTIRELERLQKELTEKFVDVCKRNQMLAESSAPKDWFTETKAFATELRDNLRNQCRKIETFYLVARNSESGTEWCKYIRLCGFTDDLGNTSAERWICFNLRNNRHGVSVHNCLCLPLSFEPHREYHDNRDAVTQIRTLLSGENCETLVTHLPVPIKRLQVQKLLGSDLVQSVSVDNNHVVVVLRPKVFKQHLDKVVRTVCDKLASCVPHQTQVKRSQVGNNWILRIAFVAETLKAASQTLTAKQVQGLRLMGFDEQSIADFAQCVGRRA